MCSYCSVVFAASRPRAIAGSVSIDCFIFLAPSHIFLALGFAQGFLVELRTPWVVHGEDSRSRVLARVRLGLQLAAVTRHRWSLAAGTVGAGLGGTGVAQAHPLRAPCGLVRGHPESIMPQGSVPPLGSQHVWGPLLAHHVLSSAPCPSNPRALRHLQAGSCPGSLEGQLCPVQTPLSWWSPGTVPRRVLGSRGPHLQRPLSLGDTLWHSLLPLLEGPAPFPWTSVTAVGGKKDNAAPPTASGQTRRPSIL